MWLAKQLYVFMYVQVKYNLDYHCELMLLSLDQLNEAKTRKRRDSIRIRKSILREGMCTHSSCS